MEAGWLSRLLRSDSTLSQSHRSRTVSCRSNAGTGAGPSPASPSPLPRIRDFACAHALKEVLTQKHQETVHNPQLVPSLGEVPFQAESPHGS